MSSATYVQPPLQLAAVEDNPAFKMLCPRVQMGTTGSKVLFVLDRVASEEIRSHRLLEGDEIGGTFERVLREAVNRSRTPLKEFVAINYQELRLNKLSGPAKDRAQQACWQRVMDFAVRYRPDIIVFLGRDPADIAWAEGKDSDNAHLMGRIRSFKYGTHVFRGMWTLSASDWIPTQPHMFSHSMLAGIVIRNLIDAIEVRNRRTINVPANVQPIMLNTIERFRQFMALLKKARRPCIDTETRNLNRVANRLLSIQFSLDGKRSFFLPMRHRESPWLADEYNEIVASLRDWYERGETDYIIYHAAKFDIGQVFAQLGVRFHNHRVYDIQAAEFCFHPDTWVVTEQGRMQIKDLVAMPQPPRVLSWNHAEEKPEFKRILNQSQHANKKRMVEVEWEGGKLRVTEDHKIWSVTRGAYVEARSLQPDEEVAAFGPPDDGSSDAHS